ncbi:class I SAM-dependent methyltransferase [Streptomyces xanthophaeus]|uniref:class I SAM-dependent methyltransferase n=1 Tax=Streptomyces xanthophaeus TaxID=67385 RepID=UPI003723D914
MGEAVDVSVWDAYYAGGRWFRPVMDEEKEFLRRSAGLGTGRTALDVGCGTGGFAEFLHAEGCAVLGVDYSETAISLAQSKFAAISGLEFRHLDAASDTWENLPSYHLISTRLTYAFIDQKAEFLKKVRDHLIPGGVFHVMTPLAANLPESRSGIGITKDELEEMICGWSSVEEKELDAQHVAFTLTV